MAEAETFLNPSRRSYLNENSRHSGNKARIFLILLGVIILIALVIYAAIATGGKGEENIAEVPTPTEILDTPTPAVEEDPTPTQGTTPTPKTSPTPAKGTPTPTSTSTTDKASGLDRADLTVAIQNGSGVAGAATKMSDALKKLGYDVVSSGNADNFEYENTVIQVKSTKKAFADLLKKDLSGDYTIGSATSNYTGTDADAVIIVGKE